MKQVIIIAALVIVAQCQLHPAQEAKKALDDPRIKEATISEELLVAGFPVELTGVTTNFNKLWQQRLAQQEELNRLRKDDPQRKVALFIASYKDDAMKRVIPDEANNPLNDPKNGATVDRLLADSMSEESIDLNDPRMTTPAGMKIKNMRNNEIVIKKDARTGHYKINNIDAELRQIKGAEQIKYFELQDFMFQYKKEIEDLVKGQERAPKTTGEVPVGGRLDEGRVAQ